MKTFADARNEFVSGLTQYDTISVLSLSSNFMEKVRTGRLEDALDSLFMIRNNQLEPLDELKYKSLLNRFTRFPVISYKYENLAFMTQGINDVKYTFQFSQDTLSSPKMMVLMFNPVKIEKKWYLSIKDEWQESTDLKYKLDPNSPAPAVVTLGN